MTVAILGLAGADPSLVFDELGDELPTLARLVERGVHGRLRSTDPPEPAPAWTSMLTGYGPGRTSVTGEAERDWQRTRMGRKSTYGEGRQASFRHADAAPLWERAGEAGLGSILVGAPGTFPAEPIDGAVVADPPGGGGKPATHPPELAAELAGEVPAPVNAPGPEADAQQALEAARRETERRFAIAGHLAETREAELLVAVSEGPRWAQQAAWDDRDALADHYRALDEALAGLLETLDEEATVIVVSEHGAQACEGQLRLNAWLRREGYLSLRGNVDEPRTVDPELVDWDKTQAWARGGPVGRVQLNVEGREPAGSVDPLDYETLRDRIADELEDLELAEATHALKPREVHDGPHADEAPDLYVYASGLAYACSDEIGHDEPVAPDEGPQASVDREGLFVMADPDGRYGGGPDDMHVTDVAATVLDLLDVPAEDVDGRALQPDGSLAG